MHPIWEDLKNVWGDDIYHSDLFVEIEMMDIWEKVSPYGTLSREDYPERWEYEDEWDEAYVDDNSAFGSDNPDPLHAHCIFLHRLSRRRARDTRLKLFTTNYDLCFEIAAGRQGGVVIDGFSFTQPREFDPRYFGYDIVRRSQSGESHGSYLEGVFQLYKLHGSVNWARDRKGTIRIDPNPSPDDACLIYPAKGKYRQSFIQPHLELMSQYLAALREPNTCLIVVGFGFNDDHLAEPILAAVRTNPHLRLIVVDPNAEKASKYGNIYWRRLFEYSEQGDDVWIVNAAFQDFAVMIPDLKSLTPAERLRREIKKVVDL